MMSTYRKWFFLFISILASLQWSACGRIRSPGDPRWSGLVEWCCEPERCSSSVALKQGHQTSPNHNTVWWVSCSNTPTKPGKKLASFIWQSCFRVFCSLAMQKQQQEASRRECTHLAQAPFMLCRNKNRTKTKIGLQSKKIKMCASYSQDLASSS